MTDGGEDQSNASGQGAPTGEPSDDQAGGGGAGGDDGGAGGRAGGGNGDGSGWADRVIVEPGSEGFAYVPGEVLTLDAGRARDLARRLFPDVEIIEVDNDEELAASPFNRLRRVPDVPLLVRHLRSLGVTAQPNHVFFAHCNDPCCGPHPSMRGGASASPVYASPVYASPVYASPVYASPVYASPVYASPVYASPVYASPVYASPVYASPVYASPVYASPVYASTYAATGRRRSSARPATADARQAAVAQLAHAAAAAGGGNDTHVVVLDTGLPDPAGTHYPPGLAPLAATVTHVSGLLDMPDRDGDVLLDPAAGHGSFIAGLIERVAPGAVVESRSVLGPLGDGTESAIAQAIDGLPAPVANGTVLNLSFGGYVMEEGVVLASAIRGAQARGYVVVASAGNDGVCRPTFPAAFPGVVSVGAVGPGGPAPFSNYGPWVRACAPGVDLVSAFFDRFEGAEGPAGPHAPDPDDFDGWAVWTGTSFSAPIVAGALAHHMRTHGVSARQAVDRVIDDPALLRLADLGTVVNVL